MAHLGTVATATVNSSSDTCSLTLADDVPEGATLLIACAWESAAGALPVVDTVADDRGNAYFGIEAGINAGVTVSVAIIRGYVATALQAGDEIAITLTSARARWAAAADAFGDLAAEEPVDTSTNTGSSSSLATGAVTVTGRALLYAAFGFGQGRTPSIPAEWSGGPKVESSAGSADRGLQVIWRYVDNPDGYAATLTLSSSSTYAAALAAYEMAEEPPPPPPAGGDFGWGVIPI